MCYFKLMSDFHLDFHDTAVAFADKSNAELQEKYWLFKTMSSSFLVDLGTKSAQFALSYGLPVGWLIKRTIFKQFCGGETIQDSEPTIQSLGKSGIGTILDYSVEGKSEEEVFEHTKLEIIETIKRANSDLNIPFAVFKVTGIAPLGTLEKVSDGRELSDKSKAKWERIQSRVNDICEYAHSINQPVFIDAEESWIQNAIDMLADAMMERYNRKKPLIYNTLQLYRHDRLAFLKESHKRAKEGGYFLAVKLVRGAYMEKERERAEEMGYPSPIQPDKATTDHDYDLAVRYCVENINEIAVCAGSHNEASVRQLAELMHDKKLSNAHPNIFFSQLYGMSDNLSYILAKNGYNVSKYVPYGPVKDTLPYLIRRAEENTSVIGQVSRELDLIETEMKRRKLG
jgi:proline dehydrogenase